MRYLVLVPMIASLVGCLERGDSDTSTAPAVDPTVTANSFLTFVNQSLDVDSDDYANAYYRTVDPLSERTTLADWKTKNGFINGGVVHVTFRDTRDLGYGRDMFARELPDGSVAIYVDNYVVEIEPGDASSYGPLNLDAAVAQNRKYHFGTNAIEFSPENDDPAKPMITKFFTYGPNSNGVQQRITAADLDGRGVKHMPTMCVVCHGATMYPLRPDDSLDPISLKSPKLHILQQDTFQFSAAHGFTETDQQDGIAAINAMVYKTYRMMGARADSTVDQANWLPDFAEELLVGAYGDSVPGNDILEATKVYETDFVPSGWTQTASRPGGVELLYKEVIEPYCIGCHSLRGTKVAKINEMSLDPNQYPNAVNFSSYEEFTGYNDLIIDYVYQRGAMPRSLISFSQFWDDPGGAPTLLATYLSGFNVLDANGNVVKPGKSVARPGADRTVTATPVILDATASLFSDSYAWNIVTSTDPTASLDDPASPAPTLTATDGSMVTLELVTSNARGNSEPEQITVTVDSLFTPAAPDFVTDIKNIMGSMGLDCVFCHSAASTFTGIPVYYDEASYPDQKDLYLNVLNRIDLADPENSLLLRKPTSLQHGGGIVIVSKATPEYITILNWIRNGAPCGNDAMLCN